MDFQEFVNGFLTRTCLISVEKKGDGYGDIRIVAGNAKFVALAEDLAVNVLHSKEKREFIPNSLYDMYIPKNLSFEDLCFRSAVKKKPIHTYMHIDAAGRWFDIFTIPMDYEDGDLCYCTYTFNPSELADIDLMSTHSAKTSADVLKTCIRLRGTNDFRSAMQDVVQDIRILCNASVCTVLLLDTDIGTCSVLASSIMPEIHQKKAVEFPNFYDIVVSWSETIGNSDCIIIKNEKDMKYISEVNNPWYLTLKEANVTSVVLFPLKHNLELLGYIWATNFDTRNAMRIRETLELTSFFISSEIASYNMMNRLEHISYTDMLTGMKNRNALNNRMNSERSLPKQYGIIFADLNGLKRINDADGHSNGDLMLKKAAIILQEMFEGSGNEIYRTGGDEFIVFVSGVTAEEFGEKVKKLKARAADSAGVSFAVGSYFNPGDCDIRYTMRMADKSMYRDKMDFYTQHPDLKQR